MTETDSISNTSMTHERFFLGLDGGQSHTTILIGNDRGAILGSGSGGPTNYGGSKDTIPQFDNSINKALEEALKEAKLQRTTRFSVACCGMSGSTERMRELIAHWINTEKLEVVPDAQIALWGATDSSPGIVVVAGTGSIAWGENDAGATARAGGWGYVFGDEGGAFDVVRQAMRALLRAEEGWGPTTSMKDLFLENRDCSTVSDLLHQFYAKGLPRDAIASLSLLVDRAAEERDEVAKTVLDKAGLELAQLAQSVRKQLFKSDREVTISFVGGVFCASRVLDTFRAQLTEGSNEPNVVKPPLRSPAHGALMRACKRVG